MEKLTYLERKIITAIAETHPYAAKEVEKVYRRCNSYDTTIKVLEESQACGLGSSDTLDLLGY